MEKEEGGSSSSMTVQKSVSEEAPQTCSQSISADKQSVINEPVIQMVPWLLRQIEPNKKCFDPVLVSLGPYHHGKEHLQPMEKYKEIAVVNFHNDKYLKLKAIEAKKYYCNLNALMTDDSAFAEMMIRDACFVLDFINDIIGAKEEEHKGKSNSETTQGQGNLRLRAHQKPLRDMMLLENQLPFSFLKFFMSYKETARQKEQLSPVPRMETRVNIPIAVEHAKSSAITELLSLIDKFIEDLEQIYGLAPNKKKDNPNEPVHILERFRKKLLNIDDDQQKDNQRLPTRNEWYSFRSITELKAAGIKFSRSSSSSLQDIKFSSHFLCGMLFLPTIVIDDSTKCKFLNMIAYEMCSNAPTDYGIASYVCFLDSLIDSEEDVKELRSNNILLNALGSDKEVADLFNVMSNELTPNPNSYAQVKKAINDHCKTKWKVSLANLYHTHFSSTWTTASFIAALILLVLSFIQAYFAIRPAGN